MSPFWRGYLLACALHVWLKDYIGKEAYTVMIQEQWISWYYTTPAMILIVIIAYWPSKKKPN